MPVSGDPQRRRAGGLAPRTSRWSANAIEQGEHGAVPVRLDGGRADPSASPAPSQAADRGDRRRQRRHRVGPWPVCRARSPQGPGRRPRRPAVQRQRERGGRDRAEGACRAGRASGDGTRGGDRQPRRVWPRVRQRRRHRARRGGRRRRHRRPGGDGPARSMGRGGVPRDRRRRSRPVGGSGGPRRSAWPSRRSSTIRRPTSCCSCPSHRRPTSRLPCSRLRGTKPIVAALVGRDAGDDRGGRRRPCPRRSRAASRHVVELRGGRPPSDWSAWRGAVARSLDGLRPAADGGAWTVLGRDAVLRGADAVAAAAGAVWSNTPLDPSVPRARSGRRPRLPRPRRGGVHEGTAAPDDRRRGPARAARRRRRTTDDVAVVLLDVVLGDGAHADPASVLAPACAALASARRSARRRLRPRHRQGPAGTRPPAPGVSRKPAASSRRRARVPRWPRRRSPCAGPTIVEADAVVTPRRAGHATPPSHEVGWCTCWRSPRRCRSIRSRSRSSPSATRGSGSLVPSTCRARSSRPPTPAPDLETRVFEAIDALEASLRSRTTAPAAGAARAGLHRRSGRRARPRGGRARARRADRAPRRRLHDAGIDRVPASDRSSILTACSSSAARGSGGCPTSTASMPTWSRTGSTSPAFAGRPIRR